VSGDALKSRPGLKISMIGAITKWNASRMEYSMSDVGVFDDSESDHEHHGNAQLLKIIG
jgi:hypothetical protein